MIAVDWGTTHFRAFRLHAGHIVDRRERDSGILTVAPGAFPAALRDAIGSWLAEGESQVLICGMAGSRQGWCETPYLACPTDANALAGGLVGLPFEGATVKIVPGVRGADPSGVPEVMRGEETQVIGALDAMEAEATACLPGTHCKWVTVRNRQLTAFTTYMTGEAFAALRGHTILGRMMQEGPVQEEAFRRGLARSRQGGGLLHHLFGVRTLGLFGQLPENEAFSFLSGLLIGHEVGDAAPKGTVHLIGAPSLCKLYQVAIEAFGGAATLAGADAAARGLAVIAERTQWT